MEFQGPEPEDILEEEDEGAAQRQEEAFARQYDNDHTWEALQEDEHGMLRLDQTVEQRAKRQRTLHAAAQTAHIRKGMIRYMLLVIDVSSGANAPDLRPTRLGCMLRVARDFIRSFFDQNPLSQLGLLVMRNGVCERLTELSGSPEAQVRRLEAANLGAEGAASLQNALDMAVAILRNIPPYGYREVVFLFAALSTCDPGSIFESIRAAKEGKIRVSVVGVAAEVYVCRRMADDTGGTYGIALHESHLEELLCAHAPPPPVPAGTGGAELVQMGFPERNSDAPEAAVFVGADVHLGSGSYSCPRCAGRVAELPGECHVCNLTLISSPHLARSYHHLFPVPCFKELSAMEVESLKGPPQQGQGAFEQGAQQGGQNDLGGGAQNSGQGASRMHAENGGASGASGGLHCFGCLQKLDSRTQTFSKSGPLVLSCPGCGNIFCYECDAYVHESLHNCPGCESSCGQPSIPAEE